MCRNLIYLAFVLVLGLASGVCAELIGHWTFDDPANLGADSSGTGNDGTVEGDAAFSDEAMLGGGALLLDGTDDYINVGLGAGGMLADWTSNLTISAWINPVDVGRQWNCFFGHAVENNGIKFELMTSSFRFTTLGVMDYDLPVTVASGEWSHVAATFNEAGNLVVFYVNGQKVGERAGGSPANTATGQYNIGYGGYWEAEQFQGLLDEVRIYNHVLPDGEIKQLAFRPKAYSPDPPDGAIGVLQPLLQWTAGTSAQWHKVYVGMSPDLTDADVVAPQQAFPMYWHFAGFTPGATHYWRVDEIHPDQTTYIGDVWSFTMAPLTAFQPVPTDGMRYMSLDTDLAWTPGQNAVSHDIYFGTDRDAVAAGDAGVLLVSQPEAILELDPLAIETTYYWRVDEIDSGGTKQIGDVWSFQTLPEIPVTDPSLLAWWKLDEGMGGNVLDWSGHGHHGTLVGDTVWAAGYDGGALYFDGSGDYVDFGTPADLYLPESHSYSAWFKVGQNIDGNSGAQYLLCVGSRSDLVFGVEDGVGVNGDVSLHYYDTVPGFHAVGVGQTSWRDDEWHLVVGTKDAATGHKIYLDGQFRSEDTNTNDDNFGGATGRLISIGGRGWTGHQYYNGQIDDVRIYNKALTEQEVLKLMRGDPLLAWDPQPAHNSVVDIRAVASLDWQPGDAASQHDVYFGTDADAVAGADTTSPEYQGRQPGTSYALAGLVEFGGGTYFWRIDDVEADAVTLHKGRLWAFTVTDYLIVDDFESYVDDVVGRIFQAWIDGWGYTEPAPGDPGNGTGATVGYLDPPFAERTIVHSGNQSMPFDYNNIIAPYYSETERTWMTPQNWTLNDVDTLQLFVQGAAPRFVETAPGQYTVSSVSGDVWDLVDHMRLVYKRLSGDGTIVAKIDSMTNTAAWAKAGVMIRGDLMADGTHALMMVAPGGRPAFQNRPTAGGVSFSAHGNDGDVTFPQWVKLERKGHLFTAYYSDNGTDWVLQTNAGGGESPNPQTINMLGTVYVGLAVTSNNLNTPCIVEFSEVTTTGSVTGQWQVADIGGNNRGNDPATLYVALQDSAGRLGVVPNTDPGVVLATDWTPCNIPLSDFATDGVNLAAVTKMYVGVGDRDNPQPDGAGMLFIDDIRVIKSEP